MDTLLKQPDAKEAFNEWKSRHANQLDAVTVEMKKLDSNDESHISLSTLSVMMSELSGLVTK